MRVTTIKATPGKVSADLICAGIFEPPEAPQWLSKRAQELIGQGVFSGKHGKTSLVFCDGPDQMLVGLGKQEEFDPEKARSAAATALEKAREAGAKKVAWAVPDGVNQAEIGAALTEGTVLGSYKFDRYKTTNDAKEEPEVEELTVVSEGDIDQQVMDAALVCEAENEAREMQNLPPNVLDPSYLASQASEIASGIEGLTAEVLGKSELERKGMGALLAVAAGSNQEPCMIVMRYSPSGAAEGTLGLVGKAVTFDSGGYSLKPATKMNDMKMDMSGGAAVIEATAAIARLGLPISLVTVVPATENMVSGGATRVGDIITTYSGKTVEVTNTDAEGRLILADALSYTCELGATRIVDLATLTGAIIVALGSTYAGLVTNDDELSSRLKAAGDRSGELVWRMPLHEEYFELTKGKISDLINATDEGKAGPIYAASFLEQFVDGRPWAHLDIAGTAWNVGRSYVGKGPTGFGVRLLVEFARGLVATA